MIGETIEKILIDYINKRKLGPFHLSTYRISESSDMAIIKINIEIPWGDWRDDHSRCDYIINKFAYENNINIYPDDEEITEEDGSGCYSSIHHYIVIINKKLFYNNSIWRL